MLKGKHAERDESKCGLVPRILYVRSTKASRLLKGKKQDHRECSVSEISAWGLRHLTPLTVVAGPLYWRPSRRTYVARKR